MAVQFPDASDFYIQVIVNIRMDTLSQSLYHYWYWPCRCLEDVKFIAILSWEDVLVPGT